MVDPYRERRQRTSGTRRPPVPEPVGPGSSPTRWLAGAVLVLLVLIVLGRMRAGAGVPATPPAAPDTGAVIALPPAPTIEAAPAPVAPLPAAAAAAPATPTVDLMVRAEARRRIARAGRSVYLDTLFAESDSTLRRWPERPGEPIRVAFIRDSVFEGAGGDIDRLVRDAFNRWTSLRLGVEVEFVSDTTTAEVLVGWIRQFAPEDRRTGQTDIEHAADGTIRHGRMTLALLDPTGRRLDRAGLLLTAAHEVGHVLGLAHSDAPGDLMYPSPRSPTLSSRDTQTALLIYGLPAGSVKGQ